MGIFLNVNPVPPKTRNAVGDLEWVVVVVCARVCASYIAGTIIEKVFPFFF